MPEEGRKEGRKDLARMANPLPLRVNEPPEPPFPFNTGNKTHMKVKPSTEVSLPHKQEDTVCLIKGQRAPPGRNMGGEGGGLRRRTARTKGTRGKCLDAVK